MELPRSGSALEALEQPAEGADDPLILWDILSDGGTCPFVQSCRIAFRVDNTSCCGKLTACAGNRRQAVSFEHRPTVPLEDKYGNPEFVERFKAAFGNKVRGLSYIRRQQGAACGRKRCGCLFWSMDQ